MKNKQKILYIVISLIICFSVLPSVVVRAENASASKQGDEMGSYMRDKYGNRETFQTELAAPIVSGDKRMKSAKDTYVCKADNKDKQYLDKNKCNESCSSTCVLFDFQAQTSCVSNAKVISLQIKDFTGSGEASLFIRIDRDMDGNFDQDYSFATTNISGVCGTGFVSCNPGTKQNCTYNKFAVGVKCEANGASYENMRECQSNCAYPSDLSTLVPQKCVKKDDIMDVIQYKAPEMKEMKSECFFTNNAVGKSFSSQVENYMTIIGGAVSSVAMEEYNMNISKAKYDKTELKLNYAGGVSGDCENVKANSSELDDLKKSYHTNDIEGRGSEKIMQEQTDSQSNYRLVTDPYIQNQTNHTCEISYNPTVSEIEQRIQVCSADEATEIGGDYYCEQDRFCDNDKIETSGFLGFSRPYQSADRTCRTVEAGDSGTTQRVCGTDYDLCDINDYACMIKDKTPGNQFVRPAYSSEYIFEQFKEIWQIHRSQSCGGDSLNTNNRLYYAVGIQDRGIAVSGSFEGVEGNGWANLVQNVAMKPNLQGEQTYLYNGTPDDDHGPYHDDTYYVRYLVQQNPRMKRDEMTMNMKNTCAAYMNNPDCELVRETIHDVPRVRGHLKTNMLIPKTCENIEGKHAIYTLCENGTGFVIQNIERKEKGNVLYEEGDVMPTPPDLGYYKIERIYECSTPEECSYSDNPADCDFTKERKQVDKVSTSLDKDTGEYQYYGTDNNGNLGSLKNGSVDVDLKDPDCPKTCQVQTGSVPDTTVMPDQNTRHDTSDTQIEERECKKTIDSNSLMCPHDAETEQVISSCECTSHFGSSISKLSGVVEAAKDMICSND